MNVRFGPRVQKKQNITKPGTCQLQHLHHWFDLRQMRKGRQGHQIEVFVSAETRALPNSDFF